MYMGWDSSEAIRQYASSGSTARFDIAAGSSAGNYCIALHGNAGKVIALQQPTEVRSNLVAATYTSNTSYDDEWIFHRVLPRSGSEVSYNPELWNSSEYKAYCNCYNYAWNKLCNTSNGLYSYMQPGRAAGFSSFDVFLIAENLYYVQIKTGEEIASNAKADAEIFGKSFDAIGRYDQCNAGKYKVALVVDLYDDPSIDDDWEYVPGYGYVISPDTDYHWYRQNPNGTWSHKPGITAATAFDTNDKIIFDPQDCGRDDGYYNYSIFVGYYAISPFLD